MSRCVLCKGEAIFWFKEEKREWKTCACCGLHFIEPWPDVPAKSLYTDIFNIAPADSDTPDTRGVELERFIDRALVYLQTNGNRLLDVGCHKGSFLVRMKQRGWETVGVEAGIRPAQYAQSVYGLDVFHGGIEDVPADMGLFDVITLRKPNNSG